MLVVEKKKCKMGYREKIDELSFEEVMKAPAIAINGPERFFGISYDSLRSLSVEDWRDWIGDSLLSRGTAIPHLGREGERYYFFMGIIRTPKPEDIARNKVLKDLSENQQYIGNMLKGIVLAGRILLEEGIPEISKEDYQEAREELSAIIRCRYDPRDLGVGEVMFKSPTSERLRMELEGLESKLNN